MVESNRSLVEQYLSLPWTVLVKRSAEGIEASISELPEFVAAAATEEELTDEFWDSLTSLLETYVEAGDAVPVPARAADYQVSSFKQVIWQPTARSRLVSA